MRRSTRLRERHDQENSSQGVAQGQLSPCALAKFKTLDGRGTGVRATRNIDRGCLVLVYEGELVCRVEAERREHLYAERGDADSYMFWFVDPTTRQPLCVDATHTTHISRFINHSRKRANLAPKLVHSRIVFKARRTIRAGEELLFDYGDRRPHVLAACPWLLD